MLTQAWKSLVRRFTSPNAAPRRFVGTRARLGLEPLGERCLPSTGVFRDALGQLVIEGTAGNDTAQVSITGQDVTVDLNGTQSTFNLSRVRGLVFKGLDGDDSFTNNTTLRSTVFSGAGDDSIQGGSGRDVIMGGLGDDSLLSGGGNDELHGGSGNDNLDGGSGRDLLMGEAGDDSCHGGLDDDTVGGGQGRDDVSGDDGRDAVNGGLGDDSVNGDLGDDSVFGGFGDDSVRGGGGNDRCDGGQGRDDVGGDLGDDSVLGGDGDDFCHGDDGRDRISGGHGRDNSDRDSDDSFDDSEKGKPVTGDIPSVVTENESNNEKSLADRFALDNAGTAQLLGTSNNHNDKDFFVFTATQSGTLHVNVQTTNGVFAQVEVETGGSVNVFETEPKDGINSGDFNVTAGVTYFFRLRATENAAAAYDVSLSLT